MHLADAFIQSDLQCIQAIHFFLYIYIYIYIYKNADLLNFLQMKEFWKCVTVYTNYLVVQCFQLIIIRNIIIMITRNISFAIKGINYILTYIYT